MTIYFSGGHGFDYQFKGRYKTGGTGQLYDGFPDCEWKMNTP
jgi:hypothetical protein